MDISLTEDLSADDLNELEKLLAVCDNVESKSIKLLDTKMLDSKTISKLPDNDDIDELEKLLLNECNYDNNTSISTTITPPVSSSEINNKIEQSKALPKITEDIHFLNELNKNVEQQSSSSSASFNIITNPKKKTNINLNNNDELDSSDDEEVRNFLERKYNEYGTDINKILKHKNNEIKDKQIDRIVDNNIKLQQSNNNINNSNTFINANKNVSKLTKSTLPTKQQQALKKCENITIYTDPVFGIRIINPLISSTVFLERMSDRKPVHCSQIQNHISHNDLKIDWVVAGVIVNKSPVKTSQKGSQYSIWKLSDLKGECKMISVFLFSGAHKKLWKTAQGMVVAILNPNILEKNSNYTDLATLSVDNAEKFMLLGQSKDLGYCKSRKKNGEPCTSIVNLYQCDYCVYHVKQEYSKLSGRSELQSATAGRGLDELRNKVLGKCEVFYGGQSFVAAKINPKQKAKDSKRLLTLSEYYQSPYSPCVNKSNNNDLGTGTVRRTPILAQSINKSKVAPSLEVSVTQRQNDIQRLKLLGGFTPSNDNIEIDKFKITSTSSSSASSSSTSIGSSTIAISSFVSSSSSSSITTTTMTSPSSIQHLNKSPQIIPKLNNDKTFSIELTKNIKKSNFAKSKAIEILKIKPIEKSNPNFIKYRGTDLGKKRLISELKNSEPSSEENDNQQQKKQKLEQFKNEYIKNIINAKSSHIDLISAHENQQQEKYFNRLEKKEAMEEKMLNTFKVECKAVVCLKCRYTAFSASDHCKNDGHPLKIIDAHKRFFQCDDCGNRTASINRIPTLSCKNCHSSKWKRTSMIRERNIQKIGDQLSIRGDEEKFIGNLQHSNINLLVPDDN